VCILTQYAEGVILDMEAMWLESEPKAPMICFLSMGSDPTENIERLARNKSISKLQRQLLLNVISKWSRTATKDML
jgi:hypothetical protein